MKILMLGWELPPHNSGGLGTACYQLCKALAHRGVSIDFVVPYQASHAAIDFMRVIPGLPYAPQELQGAGGAYGSQQFATDAHGGADKLAHHLPGGLRTQQQEFTRAVKKLAAKGTYDVVHAHDWLTYEAGRAAQQAIGAPLIAHVHATEFDRSGEFSGNPLVHEIEYQGLLLADHIVAVSQLTKNIIVREYGLSAGKISVVHNSVDQTDFTPVATANSYTYLAAMKRRGYKIIVSTNRLTVQKGLRYLLYAAQLALQKDPRLLFLLCGSGEQYHELLELGARLGISRHLLFAGFVRGKQLRDAYEIADMFVMPSVSEPFGISALEAVGHGNVVLVSKQSGVCEVVRSMLTFDYSDTRKLAGYIVAVAASKGLRDTLHSNAAQEFARFSWHKVAEKCQDLYVRSAGQGALL